MKKNMTPSERRDAIIDALCKRRQDTIANLAHEFGVSVRTIKYDIEELTLAHPIETIRGRYGGGVRIADGYYAGQIPEAGPEGTVDKTLGQTVR